MHTVNNIDISKCPHMINYWINQTTNDGIIIKKNINSIKKITNIKKN
jgi:hypothetical protein